MTFSGGVGGGGGEGAFLVLVLLFLVSSTWDFSVPHLFKARQEVAYPGVHPSPAPPLASKSHGIESSWEPLAVFRLFAPPPP